MPTDLTCMLGQFALTQPKLTRCKEDPSQLRNLLLPYTHTPGPYRDYLTVQGRSLGVLESRTIAPESPRPQRLLACRGEINACDIHWAQMTLGTAFVFRLSLPLLSSGGIEQQSTDSDCRGEAVRSTFRPKVGACRGIPAARLHARSRSQLPGGLYLILLPTARLDQSPRSRYLCRASAMSRCGVHYSYTVTELEKHVFGKASQSWEVMIFAPSCKS